MTTMTHRPSLRWTTTGRVDESTRQALAESLGCSFTDEPELRIGYGTAADVDIVVAVEGNSLRIVAHFLPVALRMPSTPQVLDEEVREACRKAGLPAPSAPVEVVVGL